MTTIPNWLIITPCVLMGAIFFGVTSYWRYKDRRKARKENRP